MLIYIENLENKKVIGYNTHISKIDAQFHIDGFTCFWLDEELNFPIAPKEKEITMYLNNDITIRYEFEEIQNQ